MPLHAADLSGSVERNLAAGSLTRTTLAPGEIEDELRSLGQDGARTPMLAPAAFTDVNVSFNIGVEVLR
ncbi:hypothetical protein [Actinoplanes sp. NPDC020271]|uniref:hypothetical protein n=1 Tax=Actinoplanes sp. NPDC020271 TaxID=3363896 RepID=UPI00379E8C71